MSPTGVDEAWDKADPAALKAAGVQVVSMYLSYDTSKNATPQRIEAYHRHGIGVLLNWEATPGAPLLGAARGRSDAEQAVEQYQALINLVGEQPRNHPSIPFSCDTDTDAYQRRGPIHDYYAATRTVVHAAGYLNACYGEADLCDYLASVGLTDMEWQTYAWSGGRLSPQADFYQYRNSQRIGGAAVDFDRVVNAAHLGAWWPAQHPLNTPTPTPGASSAPKEDDGMARLVQDIKTKRRYLIVGGKPPLYVHRAGAAAAANVLGISPKPHPVAHADLVTYDERIRNHMEEIAK